MTHDEFLDKWGHADPDLLNDYESLLQSVLTAKVHALVDSLDEEDFDHTDPAVRELVEDALAVPEFRQIIKEELLS